jgi:hypothetical protein
MRLSSLWSCSRCGTPWIGFGPCPGCYRPFAPYRWSVPGILAIGAFVLLLGLVTDAYEAVFLGASFLGLGILILGLQARQKSRLKEKGV